MADHEAIKVFVIVSNGVCDLDLIFNADVAAVN
jgi:hypothetical protein